MLFQQERLNAPRDGTLKKKTRSPEGILRTSYQTCSYLVQDCGGAGDCAFRAIARAFAQIQKKDIRKAENHGCSGPTQSSCYRKWVPDPQRNFRNFDVVTCCAAGRCVASVPVKITSKEIKQRCFGSETTWFTSTMPPIPGLTVSGSAILF